MEWRKRICTCVVVSSCGILESVALRHSTVSLPPFHLQVQCCGQWPRVEDSWTQGIYQWNENYADRITQIEAETFCIVSRKIDIYLCRICCSEGTPGYNCHRKSKLWSWSKIFFFILLAMSMSSCWSGTLWGLQSLAENKYKLIIIISKMVCFKTKIYPF